MSDDKDKEMTPREIAQAWQGFRKWCGERAIDAKATSQAGDIVSTAQAIATYVITKDGLEEPKEKQK